MAEVRLSPEADRDITEIFEYLLAAEGLNVAEKLVESLFEAIFQLRTLPRRGKYPPELQAAGVTLFREIQCRPWRIFYRSAEEDIWIVAVLDGRRNIAQLLPERLLR